MLSFAYAVLRLTLCAAAPVATTTSSDGPIRIWDQTRVNPPLHLHFVSIDLRDPSVSIRVFRCGNDPDGAGPWQARLATVRLVAESEHLDVAVNGNLFSTKGEVNLFGRKTPYYPGNWACAVGWAMSDGDLWSNAFADASLIVDASGSVHIGRYARIPAGAKQIVSGSTLLVSQGRNIAAGTDLAPRTAAGVDRDGRTLTLLVIDGRRPAYSAGESLPQLAEEMIHLECSDALNLDGGGSSTLAVRDHITGKIRITNYPSDGHDLLIPLSLERPVVDVLGVLCTTRPATEIDAGGHAGDHAGDRRGNGS